MGVLDKLLNIMKLDDGDDYEDPFNEVDDDEGYEEKPKTNLFSKLRGREEAEEEIEDVPARTSRTTGSKVTAMRPSSRRPAAMEVCVMKPNSVDDAREITETLLSGRTVILNLEGLDLEVAQRIIDFTSGATFAISGNLQKVSSYIFLVTPTNVDISGDLQDLLNTSFDASSMRSRF
ncbi:cell division protein SepF [Suipraeoptans intestinalis]|uniref:Cell division protein SepF n=1 Tax=Suipraeoptans intestinalis TaxID=2606628 RepID=A0A6N7UZ71_9FIRM|nr:cell division protein SepF [Suipraeoptans intestinalis]MDD7770318.1 cell division protein SepF [Suipraeoptans intestinalis]MDY3122114.1 cell division protein SepF [Suipraeoptans intestinalis]MSR92876.1 cell division protein SepF [Suipraeoptans intestinalis]